jgi:threonine dehydrogenase-like Zn-dependent dehydrogenase
MGELAMRAAILNSSGRVTVADVPVPRADEQVLVRVEQAGICGTDLKIASGAVPVKVPRVMGHEMTGRVVQASGVERAGGRVAVGTRVLVNPGMFCGSCDLCRRDLPNLCREGGLLGRDFDGCFAEFVAVPDDLLHPVPDSVPADEAALLQVLATCVHAQSAVGVAPLESAVVVGLGVTGLLHVQLLRARGVRTIVGVTRSAAKRAMASGFGASWAVPPDGAANAVAEATGGRGADLVIECVGTVATLAQSMDLAGAGGTVLAFGTTAPVKGGGQVGGGLPTYQWYYKELTILNPRAQRPRDCDAAIALAVEGLVELAPLVTARYPLERSAQALRASAAPEQLKVVIETAG